LNPNPKTDHLVETQYKPGESGNPTGRAKGVTYPGDWIRSMVGLTEEELTEIAGDANEVSSRRMAAKCVLRAMFDGWGKAGPLAGQDLNRILDRTEGKPRLSVTVEHEDKRSAQQLIEAARREAGLHNVGE
jgi:hypothetical protein